ncbi:PKS-NRPS hybrid synthetase [Fusarium oxysporum f. sp. raphani]|uniref:PKS-NRPS hybrid synthetase n=1 Tax=Fusarium oxysporum f. sp. raphani TaxID=96318 RepID=A0A8J5U9L1_FUSOX|nr:PKS-NRPS hybrid synthetase [Fusarium oxysporum f. sp. raphani]
MKANLSPVHFFSHGSTMMLGEDSESADYWKKAGDQALANNIKGVIMMGAHWDAEGDRMQVAMNPKPGKSPVAYVHPSKYVDYELNPDLETGERCISLLKDAGFNASGNTEFDWIHDTYLILVRMFPNGCPPTTLISMNARFDPHYHMRVGETLRPLRKENYLIIGSGGAVHNLYRNIWAPILYYSDNFAQEKPPEAWALEFRQAVEDVIKNNSGPRLRRAMARLMKHPLYRDAHATDDHFMSALFVAGAIGDEEDEGVYGELKAETWELTNMCNSDEDTLSNLFASYPQTFSTFPLPHGSQGLHEPAWDLRFDYEIYLLNEFPSGRTRLQRVRVPIPGPEIDPPPFSSPPEPAQRPSTPTRAEFESAMKIVRQVVGEGQSLTIDLARSYERVRAWRERWGWSPLSSDAYESPPPYSPPRKSPTQILQVSPRAESPESLSFQQISSPFPGPIPNPPIPGDPAPSAEALFDLVNLFAKENGVIDLGSQGLQKAQAFDSVNLGSVAKWAKKRKSSSSPDASDWEDSAPQTQAELSVTDKQLVHALTGDEIPHTYRGVLMMWKRVLFAETEEAHEKAWRDLCKKFDDQRVILRYLHGTYLPVRAQWARCFLRKHRNFGIRVTSGTEASNNNIKSYLLNGMSHLYRLVEAMQDMMKDQERDFKDACAQDEVLTAREYLGSSGDYLGDLPTVISSKALGLINKQYRIARKAMPTGKNPFPEPLSDCNDDCSVSVELGVPCCHKVYAKLGSATSFTRYDVHPHWRLRDSSFQDPYRRILDPRIATVLRGRPKNTAQPVPSRMAIGGSSQNVSQLTSQAARQPAGRKRGRPPRIVNKSTLTRVSLETSQHSNTQANSEPPSDLDEQQESVLAVGGHNLASGGRGVNGS